MPSTIDSNSSDRTYSAHVGLLGMHDGLEPPDQTCMLCNPPVGENDQGQIYASHHHPLLENGIDVWAGRLTAKKEVRYEGLAIC